MAPEFHGRNRIHTGDGGKGERGEERGEGKRVREREKEGGGGRRGGEEGGEGREKERGGRWKEGGEVKRVTCHSTNIRPTTV